MFRAAVLSEPATRYAILPFGLEHQVPPFGSSRYCRCLYKKKKTAIKRQIISRYQKSKRSIKMSVWKMLQKSLKPSKSIVFL